MSEPCYTDALIIALLHETRFSLSLEGPCLNHSLSLPICCSHCFCLSVPPALSPWLPRLPSAYFRDEFVSSWKVPREVGALDRY